ncbi:MAG: peptidase M3A and M3B thimet/oligopeptidase F, partial [Tissierellia bacterium]|nr:peptidase M3A and M3B thimet/oligopeptidase F [Tissierellia bacterium]
MPITKVEELFKELKEKQVKASRLGWVQYTTGYDFGIEKAYKEITDFLQDEKNYEIILEHREKDLDPVNKRKIEIAYNTFEPFHLSKELNEINLEIRKKTNELSMILNTFRFNIDGKEIA